MTTRFLCFYVQKVIFRVSMNSMQPLKYMVHKGDYFLKENDKIRLSHTTCHDNWEFIYKREENGWISKTNPEHERYRM